MTLREESEVTSLSAPGLNLLADAGDAGDADDAGALWQGKWDEASTAVVLECVLGLVGARELWACGGVCRAWRRAAADAALWRRLLLPRATPDALRELATLTATHERRSDWSWRKEYSLEKARWERCDRQLAPSAASATRAGSAPLLCAALHSDGTFLAVADEDSRVTIFEHIRPKVGQETEVEWQVQWSDVVKTEWRSISFAQWAPAATSLLLAGRLALVDRYEMLCIQFEEDWCSRIVCRSASGPGGAGCWVDDANFLSLRLQLLAPGHACTTVWLNAASQETYSEFAGVTAPLLRIYNEASTNISHILVANVPKSEEVTFDNNVNIDISCKPDAAYYKSLQTGTVRKGETKRILLGAGGVAGGTRGVAEALLVWSLPALQLPILWVEDHLAQRVQQHRLRLQATEQEPDHEPDIEIMRALCTPPVASCCLFARILGIVVHPRGGCAWASTEAGATCVSLPTLTPLLRLPRTVALPREPLLPPHYIFPSVNDDYFVTPAGGGLGWVNLWTSRSGRRAAQLQHSAPVLAVFLLPRPHRHHAPCRLLVLTADAIHVVLKRKTHAATPMALHIAPRAIRALAKSLHPEHLVSFKSQVGRKLARGAHSAAPGSGSFAPPQVKECTPCTQAPKPTCREPHLTCPQGLRVVCCPPSSGTRPPCPPPPSSPPLTCENMNLNDKTTNECHKIKCRTNNIHEACGAQSDRVASRLAAAEHARRLDYEREVSAKKSSVQSPTPTIFYQLAGERECMRATDGRDYTVTSSGKNTGHCDTSRNPPPPCPVKLEPIDNCEISRERHLDPCSHQPRIFLEIDRSPPSSVQPESSTKCDNKTPITKSSSKPSSSAGNFTTRIIESFKRNGNISCPRKSCEPQCTEGVAKHHGDKSWCANLPPPKSVPPPCKEPSLSERLRRRPGGTCKLNRQLHTKPCKSRVDKVSASDIADLQKKPNIDKIASLLREKSNLKESGQGRVVTSDQKTNKKQNIGGGGLELKVPPSTDAVRVRVLLDFSSTELRSCRANTSVEAMDAQTLSSSTCSNGSESWLSLKNLQQKLSGCRRSESDKGAKKTEGICSQPKLPDSKCSTPSACPPSKTCPNPITCPKPSERAPPQCPPSASQTKSRFASIEDQLMLTTTT